MRPSLGVSVGLRVSADTVSTRLVEKTTISERSTIFENCNKFCCFEKVNNENGSGGVSRTVFFRGVEWQALSVVGFVRLSELVCQKDVSQPSQNEMDF